MPTRAFRARNSRYLELYSVQSLIAAFLGKLLLQTENLKPR
jgi:hypothetical protein